MCPSTSQVQRGADYPLRQALSAMRLVLKHLPNLVPFMKPSAMAAQLTKLKMQLMFSIIKLCAWVLCMAFMQPCIAI